MKSLRILSLVVAFAASSGCSIGLRDGMRVVDQFTPIQPYGYVTQPPSSGDRVRIQARNPSTGAWVTIRDNVSIATTSSWTTSDGTVLYGWDAGIMNVPFNYWQNGTGGAFARLRAQWRYNGSWYGIGISREDWWECMIEDDYDGTGNSVNYMASNCFSHRAEAYVYTLGYREGAASCPAPNLFTPSVNGHYMIQDVPSCARTIISNRMREKIDEQMILTHYEINHNATNSTAKGTVGNDASSTCSRQPGSDGQCALGGFFGGHERYLRMMERHVMVYDYPWMPVGRIPAWNGNTWIPTQFQSAQASPDGDCNSFTAGCDGWRTTPITDATPQAAKPANIGPGAVCSFASADDVAAATMAWHGSGHTLTGGYFATFDSPASPLFFLWHNAVNDVWVDYRNCL